MYTVSHIILVQVLIHSCQPIGEKEVVDAIAVSIHMPLSFFKQRRNKLAINMHRDWLPYNSNLIANIIITIVIKINHPLLLRIFNAFIIPRNYFSLKKLNHLYICRYNCQVRLIPF